jgi:rod shape-determining protein MreC
LRKGNIIKHVITAAIFIALEIAALAMLNHNGMLQIMWFSEAAQGFMGSIWGSTQKVKDYFHLRSANDSLALENHALRVKVAQMEEAMAAAGAAMPELAEGKTGRYSYIPANIMKISNNSQHNYMIIGKGAADGVVEGSGVITGRGAVGIIDAVSENFSYARSFKNHEMSISARLGRNGAVGPLSWDGRSSTGAILKEIPHHVEFHPGDTVYTSGYSSIFPADIPLGTAGKAKIVNGATYEINVTLFEDFAALRHVTIVENLGREEMKTLEGEQ